MSYEFNLNFNVLKICKMIFKFLVLVKFCTPGGAAMASHLRSGDEILAVNGRPIRSSSQDEIRAQLSVSLVRITFISWPGCQV